jgi:hypothetical protein
VWRKIWNLRWLLDEGPRSRDPWIQAILLVESFKLVPPRPLDKGPRPKSGKLRLNLHGTWFEGKINWFGPNKQCYKESSWFGEPRIRLGTKVHSNTRIQFASNQSKSVQLKDSICFKSLQITPTQGFNLLQITPNQSNSRIQFASNHSKLVPRKLDPRLSSKVGLIYTLCKCRPFVNMCVWV